MSQSCSQTPTYEQTQPDAENINGEYVIMYNTAGMSGPEVPLLAASASEWKYIAAELPGCLSRKDVEHCFVTVPIVFVCLLQASTVNLLLWQHTVMRRFCYKMSDSGDLAKTTLQCCSACHQLEGLHAMLLLSKVLVPRVIPRLIAQSPIGAGPRLV